MQEDRWSPAARSDGLVVQDLGDETLVFDRGADVAHCLGGLAAQVWRVCDGEHDLVALAATVGADEGSVAAALRELQANGLLAGDRPLPAIEEQPPLDPVDASGLSRRRAIKRLAGAGIAATSVSLIISATVGTPLAVASGGASPEGDPCTSTGGSDNCAAGLTCVSSVCVPTGCNSVLSELLCNSLNLCVGGTCTTISGSAFCCP
jgi:hypothetical protein